MFVGTALCLPMSVFVTTVQGVWQFRDNNADGTKGRERTSSRESVYCLLVLNSVTSTSTLERGQTPSLTVHNPSHVKVPPLHH